MSDEINIGIAGNSNKFVRATEDVEEALKDVAESLDDMTDDTVKGADEAERAVEDLAEKFDEVRKGARDAADAGKDAGRDIDDGMRKASDGAEDFKQEANSTAKEAAASFDGSAESIVDAFQEVAANAFEGFGPVGAAAGLAAAAGIGLAVAGFEEVQKRQEEAEQSAADWADKFIESGQRIATAAQQTASIQDIATDPEKYKEAGENAKSWGVDVSTAMLAMSGNTAALEVVKGRVEELSESTKVNAEEMAKHGTSAAAIQGKMKLTSDAYNDAKAKLDSLTSSMKEGGARADVVSQAYLGMIDAASGATVQVDKLGNKVVTLPDETQIFIDAKTGQASQSLDRFKGDVDKLPKQKAIVVKGTVDLDKSAITNYSPTITAKVNFRDRHGNQVL